MTITLKSEADLAKMRVAGRLAADVLDMIAPYIVPGVSTAELDRRCHDYITNVQQAIPACLNYGSPPFPASTCISVNHVICHGIPSDKTLKNGDIVNIDVTVIKDGWHGDGKPIRPGRAEQMLDILASCHSPQPLADLKAPPNPRPLTLTLDDKPYTLGGYNTYHHAHYLDDGTTVWLCSENLKAMLALRYDLYSYKSTKSRVATINGERRHDTVKDDQWLSVSPQELSYRGGLVWLPTESLSFYGSIGSFFAPDQTLSLNPATQRFYDKDGQAVTERRNGYYFEPRRGYQAELGAKYTLGEVLDLSLSGYFIRQQNEVVRTTQTEQVGGATKRYSVSAQIGATESKGFEAEATLHPPPGPRLRAGYGYTDAAIADVNETPVSKLFNIKKGTPLAWVPKHTLYTYGGYELQRGALRGLGLNSSLTYRSEMYYNVGAGRTLDPTTQLDLGASYRLSYGISLELQVRNVLGTKSWASTLGTQLMPAEPTNALVTLRYEL